MADQESLKITFGHLLTLLGAAVAVIGSLVTLLWNLLVERVKKSEQRLDNGTEEFTQIRVRISEIGTDVNNLGAVFRTYQKAVEQHQADSEHKLGELDVKLEKQITKCEEKNH